MFGFVLSYFYRQLCARHISKNSVSALEQNIAVLICKLEKIFPLGFFNPMQHLMIHLPEEVRLGGPVQYQWMYPIERAIQSLGKKYAISQELRAALLKLNWLRRPQILFPFSLNQRFIRLETKHLDMMMEHLHFFLIVIYMEHLPYNK